MYEKTNSKLSVFVLTMQRYERFRTPANLFSESDDFFSETAQAPVTLRAAPMITTQKKPPTFPCQRLANFFTF